MSEPSYWLDLFTLRTWQEFLDAGEQTSGFRESRWGQLGQIAPGDYLLCYLAGEKRWVGLLKVTRSRYHDAKPVWSEETFPARLGVRVVARLEPGRGIPVTQLRDRLSVFRDLKDPKRWSALVRGAPRRWPREDGAIVAQAIRDAAQ